jgi:hypothetical protein
MSCPRFIELDGKRYLWRDIPQLRREQRAAFARAAQPALFELKVDRRPEQERTAAAVIWSHPCSQGFATHGGNLT